MSWGGKLKSIALVVYLALGLVLGISGAQARGPEVRLSADVDQYPPLEPQSACEFQMLMAAPRTPCSSLANINKTSALLWQTEQCQLVATTELIGSADFGYHPEASATLKLPHDVELRVSFLYDLTPPTQRTGRSVRSYLLFKYSMDYQFMPNLQVGLSGYLYQQRSSDFLTFKGPQVDKSALGLGPGVKYDLGRWSFLFQSQVETGSRDRDEGINNWFRVWYVF